MSRLKGTNLVVFNSGVTYLRMFLSIGLTLLSSRWILAALGQTDFGLYAVVGGIMGFLSFLTSTLTGSAQRHFAYAIGEGDVMEVNRWFNASFRIHAVMAVVMVVLGLPFGYLMLQKVLTIPSERLMVCHAVFICTLITVVISVLATPFSGMLTAKQYIYELAGFQFGQVVLLVSFAYLLLRVSGDRLLVYAIGMTLIALLHNGLMALRCVWGLTECRIRRSGDGADFKRMGELLSFAGWTLFGGLGYIGCNQGIQLLINIFHGPKVNAAFGIANQVSSQATGLAQAFFNAVAPEITASEGRGNRERMVSLALRASKFSVLLISLLLVPLLVETELILSLWLKEVPQHAPILCRIILCSFLIDKLTVGYMVAIAAHGKIAGYQATVGGIMLLAPFIAWSLFAQGQHLVVAIGMGLLVTRTLSSLGRVWWVEKLLGVSLWRWLSSVPLRIVLPLTLAIGVTLLVRDLGNSAIGQLLISCGSGATVLAISSWLLALDKSERSYIGGLLQKSLRRVWA